MFKVIHPNRWFFWAIAVILISGLLLWWAVEFYSIEQDSIVTPVVVNAVHTSATSTSAIDMSTWKTYTNSKYGFEIKYPLLGDKQEIKDNISGQIQIYQSWPGQNFVSAGIDMEVKENLKKLNLRDWIELNFPRSNLLFESGAFVIKTRDDGIIYATYGDKPIPDSYGEPFLIDHIVISPDKTKIYIFSLGDEMFNYWANKLGMTSENLRENIFATFKFIEPTAKIDISTWKTYQNKKYGFEMRYPSSWFIQREMVASYDDAFIASKSVSDNVHGVGLPLDGLWVGIVKSICNEPTDEYISMGKAPDYWEKAICEFGFQISLGYWPSDGKKNSQSEIVLNQILSTFKFLK